ncbi:hypothetical protein ACLOJK_029941 [Asimina triloba]
MRTGGWGDLDREGRQQRATSWVSDAGGAGIERCRLRADGEAGESSSVRASSDDGSSLVGLISSA